MEQPPTPHGPQNLTLANIHHIDNGKVAIAFTQAIRQIITDVNDRPNDNAARKIVLTAEAKPVLDKDTGVLDTVDIQFKLETKLPKRQSVPYPMLPTADGRALFQPRSPFDPRQQAFEFAAPPPPGVDPTTGELLSDDDDSDADASGGDEVSQI